MIECSDAAYREGTRTDRWHGQPLARAECQSEREKWDVIARSHSIHLRLRIVRSDSADASVSYPPRLLRERSVCDFFPGKPLLGFTGLDGVQGLPFKVQGFVCSDLWPSEETEGTEEGTVSSPPPFAEPSVGRPAPLLQRRRGGIARHPYCADWRFQRARLFPHSKQ